MSIFTTFLGTINILLAIYTCYSWYWQAKLSLRGRYRISVLIWTLIIIWAGFTWNYIEKGEPGLNFFLALILLISIVDGFTGFAPKRAVVSGYFKRTVPYSKISDVRLIYVPVLKKERVICIIETVDGRSYLLQFNGSVNRVIETLKKYADHDIHVRIQSGM